MKESEEEVRRARRKGVVVISDDILRFGEC